MCSLGVIEQLLGILDESSFEILYFSESDSDESFFMNPVSGRRTYYLEVINACQERATNQLDYSRLYYTKQIQ